MENKTMTLEEFADLINEADLRELDFDDDVFDIIFANNWTPIFDEYDLAEVYRTNGEQCKIDKNGKILVSE